MSLTGAHLSETGNKFPDSPQARIHQGRMFHCSHLESAVADDGFVQMVMTTPDATDYTHMTVYAACGGNAIFSFHEGATFTGGTALATPNQKRYSTATWRGTMTSQPDTVPNTGTQLLIQFLPGGSGGNAIGAGTEFNAEWALKPSTNYLIRLQNVSGQTQYGSIGCSHYASTVLGDR